MSFNPSKCEVLNITNKRNITKYPYKIHNKVLGVTPVAKYLGVNIDNKLSWNYHIATLTKKAYGINAFLQRNLRKCPRHIKEKCYKTLVRPLLEYASVVWDPYNKKAIQNLKDLLNEPE